MNQHRRALLSFLFLLTSAFAVEKTRLAVLPLSAERGVDSGLADTASVLLETKLTGTGTFSIVDRENTSKVLKEQALQQSGCTEAACQAKIGNVLNVQKLVSGRVLKIGSKYKLVIRLIDVETSGIDEVVGSVEEYAANEDDLEKAADRAARTIAERLPIYGQVINIDGDITVDLGKKDRVPEGADVEVRRSASKITNQLTGDVLEGKARLLGKANLIEVQAQYSTLKWKGRPADGVTAKIGDRVYLVVSEETKRKQADVFYQNARKFSSAKQYAEAKSEVDKALNLYPANGEYQNFRSQMESRIEEVNVAEIQKRNRQEEARSRSAERRTERTRRSGDGGLTIGADFLAPGNPLLGSEPTDFAKTFSGLGGLHAGLDLGKAMSLWGKYYFFGNRADVKLLQKNGYAQGLAYSNASATAFDIHLLLDLPIELDPFEIRLGGGAFYRSLNLHLEGFQVPNASRAQDLTWWGLGWEAMLGLRWYWTSSFGLDLRATYEIINASTIDLLGSGTNPLDNLKSPELDRRLGMGGMNFSAGLYWRL